MTSEKNDATESASVIEQGSETKKPSTFVAWALAARPKTLAAAAAPVIVALALARRDCNGVLELVPAVACFLFAILAQIAANFINDYADFKKGADGKERKGPARATASGWISPRAMLTGVVVTLALACLVGLTTLPYGGLKLVWVGAACCLFCLLYSVGPRPLSYVGLGDVLVVGFFGFVAVAFTYFLQTKAMTWDATLVGLALGFATDNILVANNYRDRDEDRANGKNTLIAIFGERFGRYFYLANGLIATALLAYVFARRNDFNAVAIGALVVYFCLHLRAWRVLASIRQGKALIRALVLSSKNLIILAVLLAVAFSC